MHLKKQFIILLSLLTLILFISCALLPAKDQKTETESSENTQAEAEEPVEEPAAAAEEAETGQSEAEEEPQTAEEVEVSLVSGLASGTYAFTNSNVVRDIAVYNGVAHTATLGGMNAWNLSSAYVMHYTPLDGMKHVSTYAAVVCDLPETRVVFGTQKGLSFYDPNTGLWENVAITPEDSQVENSKIDRLYCDNANQRLLIGYSGLGVLDLKTGAFTRFNKDNGLSWNVVADMAVLGSDIWVASGYNGIAQIKGTNVTVFNKESGMPDERANAVAAAPDGSLWVGASSGLMQFKNNVWTLYGSDTPAKLTDISEIEIGTDGKIWVTTAPFGTGRLCQFDPKTQTCLVDVPDPDNQPILALTLDEQNRPIFGTNRGLFLLDGGNLIPFKQSTDPLASNFVDAIAAAPDGLLWVGTDAGIHLLDPASPQTPWVTFQAKENPGMGGNWANGIATAPDGSAWFSITNGAASHFREGVWTSFEDYYSYDCVAVDGQGQVWLGDDSKGIAVMDSDGNPLMSFTAADGLPSDRVYALLAAGEVVWIGTDSGLAKYENGSLEIVLAADNPGLSNKYIRSLALNPDGSLVIGTILGVSVYDGSQARIILNFADLKVQDWLTTLAVSADGEIWVGFANGLFHSTDQTNWSIIGLQDGLLTGYISALHVDQYGAAWIGGGGSNYDGGGLLQIVP